MTTSRPRGLVAPLVLLCALALTACGNAGGGGAATPTAGPAAPAVFEPTPAAPSTVVSVSPTPLPSVTAQPPTSGVTATPQEATPSRDVPTDEEAVAITNEFAKDLQGEQYDAAQATICDAGRALYADGAAVQRSLSLSPTRKLSQYTIAGVGGSTYQGDPRKVVTTRFTHSDGSTETLRVSVTLERDRAAVCGF